MKKEQEKNMIELFKGYTNYSKDEYERIWKSAIIVVDTNILLNFYRYSEDTKREMIKILTNLKERLWIPYQIAKEYFKNKNNVMVNSYDEYTKLSDSLRKLFDNSIKEINMKKTSQLKSKSEVVKILEESKKRVEDLLLKEREDKKPTFEENKVEDKIIELFNKSTGADFSEEEYVTLKEEGQRRIKNKIPPGYKDDKKEENGDYYIFYSMIKKSEQMNKDFIYITDDVKEDWFNIINGEKHGGRYELLNEFYKETGNLLMIYTSDGFVKAYNKNIAKQKTDERFVDELINIRRKSLLNNNSINTFDINLDLNRKLNDYINYFLHSNHSPNEMQILENLMFLIKKSDMPITTKIKLMDTINENKYDNEEIIGLINNLMTYHNMNVEESKTNPSYTKIKYRYVKEISNIYLAKTSEQILESYNNVLLLLNRQFKTFRRMSNTTDFEMLIQLEDAINYVEKLIRNSDISMKSSRKLIDKLNSIVKSIDEYDVLNSHTI